MKKLPSDREVIVSNEGRNGLLKTKLLKRKETNMLRLTMAQEEYLMIGDDVKIIFLGGTGRHARIMIDAPKEVNIIRSSVIEKKFTDPEVRAMLPKYYAEEEHPEKYVRKNPELSSQAGM